MSGSTQPNKDMQAVLDRLVELGAKPLETLTPEQARKQPGPADAVKSLLDARGLPTTPERVAGTEDRSFAGPGGPVQLRIYRPLGITEADLPAILYIHGGGWVIANLDSYDASARALANAAGALVVSTHYRQGPEHKFPAAHDDTLAAYRWLLDNAASLGVDGNRIAVAGESAGGNMALNISLQARDLGWPQPVHQLLVYPVASADMQSPSYIECADAKPLGRAAMQWFVSHAFGSEKDALDPRISLVSHRDLSDLPPTTLLLAQIDPLRCEGEALAEMLQAAGVDVLAEDYVGVTHEFFGMGALLDEAREAQQVAGDRLRQSFARVGQAQQAGISPDLGRSPR
jgi:acetyl esterase/lipase